MNQVLVDAIIKCVGLMFVAVCLMFVHELIHYLVLKYFGYDGKLIITKKGIGVLPIGTHNNIICAKHIYLVVMMPFYFGWVWFIPFFLFPLDRGIYNIIISLVFGCVCWFGISLADLLYAKKIRKWWNI